jgi:Tol biopolymer transport system component
MSLSAGSRLGPYEIQSPLGQGGMGEVYKARDTRLDRTVAIKILPAILAADLQFRERFDREARAISQLTHPHICVLHDIGHQDGTNFLVLEYLEGETLAERLKKGALSLDHALSLAIQIASALDTAHRAGITHRDLKPGNVMVTKAGAKLLDFGLAKTAAPAISGAGLSMLPTTPRGLTAQGTILGTFQYMAPEQVEGKEADARSDIFSFGALVYEMVTGKRAFEGSSAASVVAAILEREPPPMSSLQPLTPRALDHIVKECLAKDPEKRWHSAADLSTELKWVAEDGAQFGTRTPGIILRRNGARIVVACAALAVLMTAAIYGVVVYERRASAAKTVTRFTMVLPLDTHLTSGIAVSPDGEHVVYAGMTSQGESRLYMRNIDQFESQAIAGTDGGDSPFFSPDGRWVGFFVAGAIKKVLLPGGAPFEICKTGCDVFPSQMRGASWDADNTIVFGGGLRRGLLRVSAAGGTPQELTRPDVAHGETGHGGPHVLPDGRGVLFTVGTGQGSHIALLNLQTGKWQTLFQGASPQYLAAGQIVYLGSGSLRSVPFDIAHSEVRGDAVPVADTVRWVSTAGFESVLFAVSRGGTLVFVPSASPLQIDRRLVWVNRKGEVTPIMTEAGRYLAPHVSPDGRTIAVTKLAQDGTGKIWMIDAARGAASPFAIEGTSYDSIWTPDGKKVAFVSNGNIVWAPLDKSNGPDLVLKREFYTRPFSWTPDGRTLAFVEERPATTGSDIWTLRVDDAGEAKPLLVTKSNETEPMFSPDGHRLAYVSDESGKFEVYVTPFPDSGGRFRISVGGGDFPLWSPDGHELFYWTANRVVSVTIGPAPAVESSPAQVLFQGAYFGLPGLGGSYDISPDGRRFLMIQDPPGASFEQINVVLNWSEELKRPARAAK